MRSTPTPRTAGPRRSLAPAASALAVRRAARVAGTHVLTALVLCHGFVLAIVAALSTNRVERAADPARRERERGDVPGWVLITLMTAGLVTVIWAAAGPQLEQLFTQAISSVTGPGKK